MSLLQQIKNDQLAARKAKESVRASLLTTLLGEATAVGKNDGNRETIDAETVAVIKKFLKNISETLAHRENDQTLIEERDILKAYLPKQLSSEELIDAIQLIIDEHDLEGPRSMGVVMKELKAKYDGQFEGRVASETAKDMLA